MRRYVIGFLLIFAFWNSSYGQTFPVKTIVENGPRDNRINMVFLGDGYQITEMNKYEEDVQATIEKIFNEMPYSQYKNLFNVYAIEVPSKESGTDHPGTAPDCPYKDSVFFHDTYFNTTFDFGGAVNGIHRLLVAQNYTAINNVLINNFPDYDMVMMVVNHHWYGGSGGSISVYSTNTLSAEIAIHEAGHSFGGLADEYGGTAHNKFDGINVTQHTELGLIPWNTWISPETPLPTPPNASNTEVIGLFEGAYYSDVGMYRPKLHCKMRELNVPFCEVCTEQLIKSMFGYVDLIDSYQPDSTSITLYTNDKAGFDINMVQLSSKEVSVEWALDGNIINENVTNVLLDGPNIKVGKHNLSVTAKHNTDLVRKDPDNLLESTVSWTVNVVNPTDVNEDKIPNEFVLEQNYPNPFNPSTTIKFSIPTVETQHAASQHVILRIYDILGKEIATLVKEEKSPGNYEVAFNTGDYSLPSGIYFYKLTAGSFSETKKMLLLK